MSNVPIVAGGAFAAYGMTNEALKTIGPIVVLEPGDFLKILEKNTDGIVVHAPSRLLSKNKYITSYKGLIFFTKTKDPLILPTSMEMMVSKKLSIPEI